MTLLHVKKHHSEKEEIMQIRLNVKLYVLMVSIILIDSAFSEIRQNN